MLLEIGERGEDEHIDDKLEQPRTTICEWDTLKNTKRAKPTIVHNRYDVLLAECDTDDDEEIDGGSDSEPCERDGHTAITMTCSRKRRPNQRQRRRNYTQGKAAMQFTVEEKMHDISKADQDIDTSGAASWCPGPEHCGSLVAVVVNGAQ